MSELIKRSEDWLDYHKGAPLETDAMKLIAELVKRVKELEQQLQQAHRDATEEVAKAHKRGWEQGKQQASGICKADIQEHAITISAAQQETHNNCCNYLAKAIDAMEYNHGN